MMPFRLAGLSHVIQTRGLCKPYAAVKVTRTFLGADGAKNIQK